MLLGDHKLKEEVALKKVMHAFENKGISFRKQKGYDNADPGNLRIKISFLAKIFSRICDFKF